MAPTDRLLHGEYPPLMAVVCPFCHGTGYVPEANPIASADALRMVCRERGLWISPDGAVREEAAADILGKQAKTLRNWRANGAGPPWFRRAGRVVYPLDGLAAELARN